MGTQLGPYHLGLCSVPAAPRLAAMWEACIIEAHGIFRLLGRVMSVWGWRSCSLPKGSYGLGKLPEPCAGTDVSSWPDPGLRRRLPLPPDGCPHSGECIIEHMGSLQPDLWSKRLSCVPVGGNPQESTPSGSLPSVRGLCGPLGVLGGSSGTLW